MTEFVGKENGMPIRQPSVANLMVDSADRNNYDNTFANSFTIQRNNSILNGFFTRIGTTEVVLDWFGQNISQGDRPADTLIMTLPTIPTVITVDAPSGTYTQADLVNWVNLSLTANSGVSWVATKNPHGVGALLTPNAPVTVGLGGTIATKLNIASAPVAYGPNPGQPTALPIFTADLRPYTYIDFISSQLTANQSVKDASTASIVRDVLCRWYWAFDEPPSLDEYGFPILMGYTTFCLRRTFSPAKQIRWETNIPIGNLSFEVVDSSGNLVDFNYQTNWLMTLQVSEV